MSLILMSNFLIYYFMNKKFIWSIFLLALMGFSSYNSDFNESIPAEQELVSDRVETMSSLELLAKNMAKVVADAQVREFVKDEVLKQEDGDYEILFSKALNKEVSSSSLRSSGSGKTFREYFEENTLMTKSGNNSIKDLLSEIQANYPLLQIAVPNMESVSWEKVVSGERPFLVAFLDEDYDDMSGEAIIAYDQDGNLHILDGVVAPEDPVIVISESERVFFVPVSEKDNYSDFDQIYETSDYAYFKKNYISILSKEESVEEIDNEETSLVSSASTTSYRAEHPTYWDYITKAQLTTDEDFESWAKGRPEIKVNVVFYGLDAKKILYDDKGWANSSVRYLNSEVICWNPTQLGNYITYYWYEEDGGGAETISVTFGSQTINGVNLPGVTMTFEVGDNDDFIGNTHVYYTISKAENEYYPSDLFRFWITVKYKM